MRVGIFLPAPDVRDPAGIPAAAVRAESAGLESVWTPDLVALDGSPALDPLVTLAAAGGATSTLRLGTAVLVPGARPPALLATHVAAVHALTGGRLLLGVGLGGPPTDSLWAAAGRDDLRRGPAFHEAVGTLTGLLSGRDVCLPGGGEPVRLRPSGMPPVLVGGQGSRSMRRAVELGAGWLPSMYDAPGLATAVAGLRAEARRQDRPVPGVTAAIRLADPSDPGALESFRRHVVESYGQSRDAAERLAVTGDVGEALDAYAEAGAERVVVAPVGGTWESAVDRLAAASRDRS